MFDVNTLFILGAGASCPYGYPLGKELIDCIIKDMNDTVLIPISEEYLSPKDPQVEISFFQDNICDLYNEINNISINEIISKIPSPIFNCSYQGKNISLLALSINSIKEFKDLKTSLEDFDPISIDTFLRDNPSLSQAGKTMILYSLLKRENLSKFKKNPKMRPSRNDKTNVPKEDNWYSYLLNDLTSGCAEDKRKLLQNKIKIITFNYDLSLDFYLKDRISKIEAFREKNETTGTTIAQEFIQNKLSIEHVYGQLYCEMDKINYGDFSEYNEKSPFRHSENQAEQMIQYISVNEFLDFRRFTVSFNLSGNIKTMYDERYHHTRSDRQEEFKRKIAWAEDIIFIGFGFDRDNLDQIGFPEHLSDLKQLLSNKTVRYLNFKGSMSSLDNEFSRLEQTFHHDRSLFKLVRSAADSITNAYINDFKKYLFKY